MAKAKPVQPNPIPEPEAEAEAPEERVYYIVNPAGAVHTATRDHARERLGQVGYRKATPAEIEKYKATAIQRSDRPIAKPFTVEPDVE